ncbi:MAG TPA: hypothetical protein VM616_04990 [Gammaproteobacteria bacterium]|nr:hypothetical protein [Gammaproteobacteria bacterium]
MKKPLVRLAAAIRDLHECNASWRESIYVKEMMGDKTVWEGMVEAYSIEHQDADVCYAWLSPIEGTDRQRAYAVLGKPPINSAADAVRASIVADYKAREGG